LRVAPSCPFQAFRTLAPCVLGNETGLRVTALEPWQLPTTMSTWCSGVPCSSLCHAPQVSTGTLYVADRFGGWQEAALTSLASHFVDATKSFVDGAVPGALEAVKAAKAAEGSDGEDGLALEQAAPFRVPQLSHPSCTSAVPNDKVLKQQCMPFIKFKMEEATAGGKQVRLICA